MLAVIIVTHAIAIIFVAIVIIAASSAPFAPLMPSQSSCS